MTLVPDQPDAGYPLFIDGPAGRLFAVHHPAMTTPRRGKVIYLPPFAEEMNRSRRMAHLQASDLADRGFDVLILDPFGTGDSEGDFGDTDWAIWRGDVGAAVDWFAVQGPGPVVLWGLRLGALLALDAAADVCRDRVDRLLLWQPVIDGETSMTRFLRLKTVARLMDDGPVATPADLRRQLADGLPVEIAGYRVGAKLAREIGALELGRLGPKVDLPIDWLDVVQDPAVPPAPEVAAIRDAWGARCNWTAVAGPAFWSAAETTLAPSLIDATGHRMGRGW